MTKLHLTLKNADEYYVYQDIDFHVRLLCSVKERVNEWFLSSTDNQASLKSFIRIFKPEILISGVILIRKRSQEFVGEETQMSEQEKTFHLISTGKGKLKP